MKDIERRVSRLEARMSKLPVEPKTGDREEDRGVLIKMGRLMGEDARYNRVQEIRAERLDVADVSYCRKILERWDRQDANEMSKPLPPEYTPPEFQAAMDSFYQVINRLPIVRRLCVLHWMDQEEAENLIKNAQNCGEPSLAQAILGELQKAKSTRG